MSSVQLSFNLNGLFGGFWLIGLSCRWVCWILLMIFPMELLSGCNFAGSWGEDVGASGKLIQILRE